MRPDGTMRRTVLAWARLVGGVGIIALLVWRLGTGGFLAGLRVIDGPALLIACAIGLLTTIFSAWRWRLVARGLGVRLPLRTAVADYYRALFLNAALPGGVLGDVHRAVRHGQDVGSVGTGVRAVVLERAAGQIMLFAVAAPVLVATGVSAHADVRIGLLVASATVLVVAVTIAALAVTRPHGRGARALHRMLSTVRHGLLTRHTWPGVLVASALVLAGHLATFVVAARAAGSSAPIGQLIPLMLLALMAMSVPLNVGGWGPREGVTAWAFGAAGLGATLGLTVAVVYGLLAFAASLPGAGVLGVRWVSRLRAARSPVDTSLRVALPGREGLMHG